MARSPTIVKDDDAPALIGAVEKVTYTPAPGDPPEVTWMGHKFRAHIPHDVRNQKLVDMARTNKFFHVGAFDPAQHAYRETITEPMTAEAYRAWVIGWMKKLASVESACEQWANEARMRVRLEVGFDDYKYISDFFQPVLSELIKREDEPRQVRDRIIRNGEFADLMLQVGRVGEAA